MRKSTYLLLLSLMVISSCASTGVDYTYYVIHPEADALYAADPKNDLPLATTCNPDDKVKAKCVGMLVPEFFKMKQELLELRSALSSCQKGPPPK